MTDRNLRYDLCTFFIFAVYIFLNEIQGKAFVIDLSFEDRNRFYMIVFL